MTNDEFNGVNQLFNKLICDSDLNDTMSVGTMRDQEVKLWYLNASHTLGCCLL